MVLVYLLYSLWILFASWVVGWLVNLFLQRFEFYTHLPTINFIPSKQMNKRIGLAYFKWIVKNTYFKYFNQKIKLHNKNIDFKKLYHEMTFAEFVHSLAFTLITIIVIYQCIVQHFLFAGTLMGMNILMNLYPSLLQQENKRRLAKLIKK